MSWFMSDDVVIPTLYATPADYFQWTQKDPPDDIVPILRACTGIVLDATAGDWYPVDSTTGLPIASRLIAALRDATCIQAAAWVKLGIDPTSGGVQEATNATATTKKIGSALIAHSDQETVEIARAQAAARSTLVPEAAALLRRNGLASATVWALG